MSVKARFAPSPTGYLHVGGARTALFNWLFVRNAGGEFRLRIENTDVNREVAEAVDQIQATLAWLGLDVDGEVTFQLDRMEQAEEVARRLVDEGKAYEDEGAIRFRMPEEGVTAWDDLVLGRIETPNEKLEDLVLLRSDGRPTLQLRLTARGLDRRDHTRGPRAGPHLEHAEAAPDPRGDWRRAYLRTPTCRC